MAETHGAVMSFLAEEDLLIYTRVKLGTLATQVKYADAGEQAIGTTVEAVDSGDQVAVQLINAPGTVLVTANGTFSVHAVLYSHGDGQVDDIGNGTAIGTALEAATAAGDIIEMMPWNVVGSTAATTAVADSGSLVTGVNVETVVAEFATHMRSIQHHIPMPLTTWRNVDTNAIADITDTPAGNDKYGGLLHAGSVPILKMYNGDDDSHLRLEWAATIVDAVINQAILPPRMDDTGDIVLHFRAAMAATADTCVITAHWFVNEGDTKVVDATAGVGVTGTTFAEYTITLGTADIASGDQTITVELTPAAHGTDALYISAIWLEYKGKILA